LSDSNACVLKYDGKRGVVWRIKFRDAAGRQVRETLGRADEGWTKRKGEAALRARLTDVAREGYVKPETVSFETFARGWLDTYPDTREHRRTRRADYQAMVENHAGMSPLAIMRMAGHSDFKTTQRYIDLAGVVFGDEVRRLADWYGSGSSSGTKKRYQVPPDEPQTRIESGIAATPDRSRRSSRSSAQTQSQRERRPWVPGSVLLLFLLRRAQARRQRAQQHGGHLRLVAEELRERSAADYHQGDLAGGGDVSRPRRSVE
jgi:hypothetical protein